MGMPLKLAIAQTIARKILENPSDVPELREDAELFVSEVWHRYWSREDYSGWEKSAFWTTIAKRLPEILEKLSCTENVQNNP